MVVTSKRFSVQEKEIYDHFLRGISWDWGYKGYNKRGELVPLHANTNQRMMLYGNQCRAGVDPRHRAWPDVLSQKLVRAHTLGETTLYVTGNHWDGHWSYRAGDIDCHGKGTLEDAMAFFRFLNRKYFKNRAYWEVSTNGNGIHFWFEVHPEPKYSFTAKEVNVACLHLQDVLRSELLTGKWNVSDIEIKALAPEFDEETRDYKAGQFCRMPREFLSRPKDWLKMCRITVTEIDHLEPVRTPVVLPFHAVKVCRPCVQGSMSIFRDEHYMKNTPESRLALRMSQGKKAPTSDGHVVITEDYEVAFHVVQMAHAHPNPNGTNPQNRIQSLWEAYVSGAKARGLTARPWSPNRWKVIRDNLSACGCLLWEDQTYYQGDDHHKGRACRWSLSPRFFALLEESQEAEETQTNDQGGVSCNTLNTRDSVKDTYSQAKDLEELGVHSLWTDHNKALYLAGYDLEVKKPVFGGFMTPARRAA